MKGVSIVGRKKQHFIGLCIASLTNDLTHDIFIAINERICEYGFKLLVFNSFADLYNNDAYEIGEGKVYDLIPFDKLDGLIIVSESIKNDEIKENIIHNAHEHDVFTVVIDGKAEGCYNISFNYRNAFEAIVRHVIQKHGCRTINLIAGMRNNPFSDERIEAFRKVLAEYNIPYEEERILYGDFWSEPTVRAIDEFMKSGIPVGDAFICCNDSMAMAACERLKHYGLNVPDDVIVTGFDGIHAEQYHLPRLTTAQQNVKGAGHKAVDAIASHLEGRHSDNFAIVEHKVVWSHSCGCKAIDYHEASSHITPLFNMSDTAKAFDTFMFQFNNTASKVESTEDLSRIIIKFTAMFGYYYITVCVNGNFMHLSRDYSKYIKVPDDTDSSKNLILTECFDGQQLTPYYAEKPQHLEENFKKFNCFVYWPIHFQDLSVGYGVCAMSTGCDGLVANADMNNFIKYTRNLNHVLEMANNQSVMKQVIAKLQDLYIRDHVTGLYNRRGFYTEINRVINAANECSEEKHLIIISLDMDGLKYINDTYGHAEGDEALKEISSALISIWGESEICSRFGGDEFTIASICSTDPDKRGKELIDSIQKHMDNYNEVSGKPYKVRGSFGMYHDIITPDIFVDNLIKEADDLMYKEKSCHKETRYRSSLRKG